MDQSTARPERRRGVRDALARVGLCALTLHLRGRLRGEPLSASRRAARRSPRRRAQPAGTTKRRVHLRRPHASVPVDRAGGRLLRRRGVGGRAALRARHTAAVQSLVGRELQFLAGAGAASISAALGGADTVILATTTDQFTNILMGQPDLLPTAESIRGQPVAVTRFGASSDFVARYWLRRLGLEPGADVPIIQVGGNPEMAAALVSGAARSRRWPTCSPWTCSGRAIASWGASTSRGSIR